MTITRLSGIVDRNDPPLVHSMKLKMRFLSEAIQKLELVQTHRQADANEHNYADEWT